MHDCHTMAPLANVSKSRNISSRLLIQQISEMDIIINQQGCSAVNESDYSSREQRFTLIYCVVRLLFSFQFKCGKNSRLKGQELRPLFMMNQIGSIACYIARALKNTTLQVGECVCMQIRSHKILLRTLTDFLTTNFILAHFTHPSRSNTFEDSLFIAISSIALINVHSEHHRRTSLLNR